MQKPTISFRATRFVYSGYLRTGARAGVEPGHAQHSSEVRAYGSAGNTADSFNTYSSRRWDSHLAELSARDRRWFDYWAVRAAG